MKGVKPMDLMQAHQYLYYVKNAPIWSDYDYDMWCRAHGLHGGGGSDLPSAYDYTIRILAADMERRPSKYPARYNLKKAMAFNTLSE